MRRGNNDERKLTAKVRADRRPIDYAISVLAIGLLGACSGESPPAPGSIAATASAAEPAPAPRYPDGTIRLDAPPGGQGYWAKPSMHSLVEHGVEVEMDERGVLADIADAGKVAPFKPWAEALYRYRQSNELADDPTQLCISPAGPRHLHDEAGFRIIQDRNYDRVYIMFGGGNRNWRLIFLDGREPPALDEVVGTYYGYSSGHWEEDTLVVESVGFNTRFWFSNGGLPHTESLRLTERFSRPDLSTLKYEVLIDDPLTYTRPWSAQWTLSWVEGDLEEQFCEDRLEAAAEAPTDPN